MASADINIMIDKSDFENDSTASRPQHMTPDISSKEWSEGDQNSWVIYKVPRRQHEVKEKAYEPNQISIGPYCYDIFDEHFNHLKATNVIKWSCFAQVAGETKLDFSEFLKAMKPLEERARNCYQETPYLDSHGFLEMMVYDGCFIVQLIRGFYPEEDYFKLERIQADSWYDLLLLENQLPFFELCKLYSMIVPKGGGDREFAHLALFFFKIKEQGPKNCLSSRKNIRHIKHLLDLVHNRCRPSQQHQDCEAKATLEAEARTKATNPKPQRSRKFIRSATDLGEAGVKFLAVQEKDQGLASLFDIKFEKDTKVLKIPTLMIGDNTERMFRNLMAYEQFIPSGEPTYVSDYAMFMDNLINTGRDVQLLRKSGIIDTWLGDDEVVAQMFNKLGDSIYLSEDFYYAKIIVNLNEHCQSKWNKWKATLKRDYFNSPWSVISLLATVFLLLLTLLQTIFSGL